MIKVGGEGEQMEEIRVQTVLSPAVSRTVSQRQFRYSPRQSCQCTLDPHLVRTTKSTPSFCKRCAGAFVFVFFAINWSNTKAVTMSLNHLRQRFRVHLSKLAGLIKSKIKVINFPSNTHGDTEHETQNWRHEKNISHLIHSLRQVICGGQFFGKGLT